MLKLITRHKRMKISKRKVDHIGVRHQCGQPNVNLRQVPAQVND